MHKYTKESLININPIFHLKYKINDNDVNKINHYVEHIKHTRSITTPNIGDIIQYTNNLGDYYATAHINQINDDGTLEICEKPYRPFINICDDKLYCNTSGGTWSQLTIPNKLKYIGTQEKKFCDWGHYGPCSDGSIDFFAEVNVWEYKADNNPFISRETNQPFTTKDFERVLIYYDGNDTYHTNNRMWYSDLDLQAWLRTHRAEIFTFGNNLIYAWCWNEKEHHVSPDEFEQLDLPEDTRYENGYTMRCKRHYDDTTHTIHTYYVWYWNDNGKTSCMEQNRIRNTFYRYSNTIPANQYARKEILSKKIKPLDLSFLKPKAALFENSLL